MAAHSSILAWEIPWTEEPGRLQSMGSQRVGHNWTTNTFTLTHPPLILRPQAEGSKTDHLHSHFRLVLVPPKPSISGLALKALSTQLASFSHLLPPLTRSSHSPGIAHLSGCPPSYPRQASKMLAEEQNLKDVAIICAVAMVSPASH